MRRSAGVGYIRSLLVPEIRPAVSRVRRGVRYVVTRLGSRENRRSARIQVGKGMWVAWQEEDGPRSVSRVRDLSAGGVFISTKDSIPVGTLLVLLFALPEGEMRIKGIVRYADNEKGLGVEFTKMGAGDRARLQELLRRLNR